jgi:hypothetical protein
MATDEAEDRSWMERLIASAKAGEVLDVSARPDAERRIPAQVLAEACTDPELLHTRGVHLVGALIEGSLALCNRLIPAPIHLVDCAFGDAGGEQAIDLTSATGSRVSLEGSSLDGHLRATRLRLGDTLNLTRTTIRGSVDLHGASVGGNDTIEGAVVEGSIAAPHLSVDNNLWLKGCRIGSFWSAHLIVRGSIVADDLRCEHAMRFFFASVTGLVELDGARIGNNGNGISLDLERARIGGSLHLRNGFETSGTVRAFGADVSGDLDLDGATLRLAEGLPVERLESLDGRFIHVGGTVGIYDFVSHGSLVFEGAHIDRSLLIHRSRIASGGERSTHTVSPQATPDASGWSAATSSLLLLSTTVGGSVVVGDGTEFASDLVISYSAIGVALELVADDFSRSRVVLLGTECSTLLIGWQHPPKELLLEAFTFDRYLPVEQTVEPWVADGWLNRQQPWSTDPYTQLATSYRNSGKDDQARKVAIAQGWRSLEGEPVRLRAFGTFVGLSIGFGYRRWPAIAFLGLVIIFGWGVFWYAAGQGAMIPSKPPDANAPAEPCGPAQPCFNAFVYSADVALPIIDFGQESAWRPNDAADAGNAFVVARWTVIVLGWITATVLVASLSAVVRRD